MPLITKPNYNHIFASQAPDQDKPAVFNNYPEGWGLESRPNNGKPTIKGFNYLQQTSDLKDLWILQNGACLPYDESIEYAEGAPVLKDGVIQYKTAGGFKSRDAVTIPTYNSAADGVDPVTGVADGAYFNVRSSNDESYIDEYQNVGGVPTPSGKSYPSAKVVKDLESLSSNLSFQYSFKKNAITRDLYSRLTDTVSVKDYGAIGDGAEHPLSEKFPSLSLAKVVYPFATSLDQQIDGCAIQAAINDSSTMGFVAYVPAGNYMHDGVVYSNKSKLRGSGSGSTILTCVNTEVQNTVLVPDGSPSWFTEWELSGLTLTSKVKTAGQAGFKLDVCRGGLISNVIVQNMGMGWREKGCWNLTWFRVAVTSCLKVAEMESANYAGIPNYRYGLYCSGNTTGIEIFEKGLSGTTFIGGGIERCQDYALKIVGSENRALKFIGFNFEDNNLPSNGYDVIVGDNAVSNSGVPNLSFDSCQFTCSAGASKTAFSLQRGLGFSVKNCPFNGGYIKVADVSNNFGRFEASNLTGIANFCESDTVGVMIPTGASVAGTKASCVVVNGNGTTTVYQSSSSNPLIASRRTTESYNRFSISANGSINWHPFNTENPDVQLLRKENKTLQVNGAFSFAPISTANRPTAAQAGVGAVMYNSTTETLDTVVDNTWRKLGVMVAVPATSTAPGRPGHWSSDDSYLYIYTGDGTTHKWSRVPLTTW